MDTPYKIAALPTTLRGDQRHKSSNVLQEKGWPDLPKLYGSLINSTKFDSYRRANRQHCFKSRNIPQKGSWPDLPQFNDSIMVLTMFT